MPLEQDKLTRNNPFIMPDGTDISGLHADVVKAIKPKLTFEAWYKTQTFDNLTRMEIDLLIWKAAQENV